MNAVPLARLVPAYVRGFSAYIPSKPDPELMKLYGCSRLFRLNNNENALGPPPECQEILRKMLPVRSAIYPSGDCFYLRRRLAERFGKHEDRFMVGNGANEVISFVIKAFCEQGDNIVTADRTFAVYEWIATFSGLEAKMVPLKDYRFDDQEMLRQIDDRTKVVFICNPNNPTGTYWDQDTLRSFLKAVAARCIVVADEAYSEFVDSRDFPDSMSLMEEYPNLVVFRTFSKMYGLAGLRIGYLVGSQEVVDVIRRTCIVYSVNTIAQEAALAAVGADEHVLRTREMVNSGKVFLKNELYRLGLTYVSGEGNFMMVKVPMSDTLAYRKLMAKGVMVRSMTGFRFPNWVRVTIALPEAMEALVEALAAILPKRR